VSCSVWPPSLLEAAFFFCYSSTALAGGYSCVTLTPYQVLHALQHLPTSQQFLDAIRSRQTINQQQFELTLREHIIGGWRDLDILTPHEAHHSSRIMSTYHTHFGVPLKKTSGWWDDRKRNQKPVLPLYLRLDIPSNLSRALSCLRLSGHN